MYALLTVFELMVFRNDNNNDKISSTAGSPLSFPHGWEDGH